MTSLKRRLRQKLGFYYRFVKTYLSNRAVFNGLIDLSHKPLVYFSIVDDKEVPESEVLERVKAGDVIMVRNLLGQLALQAQFEQLIAEHFAVDYQQLGDIHKLKTIEQIVDDALVVRRSPLTLILQSSIMQRILSPHLKAVFLELMPNLRLHLPYAKVKAHEQYIESRMGRGKINPHGQHKDSWRYHPKNTINVWISLTEANDRNGLSILPHSFDYNPKFDAKAQEIAQGVKTYPAQQWVTDMQPGDAIIFGAELLHGSIINTSNQSRVCLSMRCTPSEPEFHKKVTYNYIKVEDGRFDNLSGSKLKATGDFEPQSSDARFEPAEQKASGITPRHYDEQHIDLEVAGELKRFPRYCPHAGTDLLNGELNDQGKLMCPSHRMCLGGKPCQG